MYINCSNHLYLLQFKFYLVWLPSTTSPLKATASRKQAWNANRNKWRPVSSFWVCVLVAGTAEASCLTRAESDVKQCDATKDQSSLLHFSSLSLCSQILTLSSSWNHESFFNPPLLGTAQWVCNNGCPHLLSFQDLAFHWLIFFKKSTVPSGFNGSQRLD